MLKKTITYTDFDGEERTETFLFNLTKAEVAELELGTEGGLASKLQRIVAAKDRHEIIRYFKEILLMAYGEKSDDGRRFIKSPEIRKAFSETMAYSELFTELATDAAAAADFIKGILPTIPQQGANGGGFIPPKAIPPDVIDVRQQNPNKQ